jgi:hypothetical protein
MASSIWALPIREISSYVVLIDTPTARGTGTIILPPPGSTRLCIVTAFHVIAHAYRWHEPIKVEHFSCPNGVFLEYADRRITKNEDKDQAIIEFDSKEIKKPEKDISLIEQENRLLEGVEIGWLGYPGIADRTLCFFHGYISAWLESEEAYLVDGVAINGVSGGPAFLQDDKDQTTIVGLLTEYRPNIASGNILPGVSLVRGINPLTRHYDSMRESIEAARVQDISKVTNGIENSTE